LQTYDISSSELKMKVEDWLNQWHDRYVREFEDQARDLLKQFEHDAMNYLGTTKKQSE
jgi:hypothetical protein